MDTAALGHALLTILAPSERSIQAHFRRTLKKSFPFSPEHSEPNEMHILLQKIQAKLEKRS
jgi:hypothetical protein